MGNGIERSKDFKSTVDSMEREGILHVVTEYYYRNPGEFSIAKAEAHVLNEQQQELIDEFREDFLREDHKPIFYMESQEVGRQKFISQRSKK